MALAWAGRTLGFLAQDHEATLAAAERALEINPNSAFVTGVAGWSLAYIGKPQAAKPLFQRAVRLSPWDPERAYCIAGIAFTALMTGEHEEALAAALRAVRVKPSRATQHRAVIAALHALDRQAEIPAAVAAYRAALPEGCRVFAAHVEGLFADKALVALMVGALRAAGLPE